MKKWIALLLAALLLTALLPAGAQETPCGGWTATEDAAVPDDARCALEKALEGLTGPAYTPIALLGTQVVAGTNYCLLCRARPVPSAAARYALVYVYAALDGTATLTEVIDIDLAAF